MKLNDVITADIVRLGDGGEGIAIIENKVVFVPFAPVHSTCKIAITKIAKKYANATLIEVVSSKNELLTPFCANFTKCGGCDLQYMNYNEQLTFKRNKVANLLYKFLHEKVKVLPTISSDITTKYRNKIQLQIGLVNGRVVVGFYNKSSHDIVPISRCDLYDEWATKLIEIFTSWANENKVTVYNEKSSKGLLRNLVSRYVGGKLVVTVVINGDKVKQIDKLTESLKSNFDNFSLYISINKRKNSQILGDKLIKVYDNNDLVEVDGIKLEISPYSFFQVNDNVRVKLYNEVLKAVNGKIIIDAYSGIGVLTTQLANKAENVFGIEIVKEAVENADVICNNNKIYGQITNILGDTAIILPKLVSYLKGEDDGKFESFITQNTLVEFDSNKYKNLNGDISIVLDPPRKGCDMSVLQAVVDSGANQVVYVSCDPVTLSRDLGVLIKRYQITKVQPFDLFPNTAHVETVAVLTLKKG